MEEKSILFGSVLKTARKKAGYSQAELAERMGVTRNTVINWEADKYKPEHDLIPRLCKLLAVDLNRLYGIPDRTDHTEQQLLQNYRSLTLSGRNIINSVVQAVLEEEIRTKSDKYIGKYQLFEVPPTKAAAGTGSDYIDDDSDYMLLRKNDINKRADAVIQVVGDSMLPVYHDGDCVYVEYATSATPGEDVICTTADGGIIKRVAADGKLHSVNPALPYGDKSEDFNVRIIGRVLGVVYSSDLPDKKDQPLLEEIYADEIAKFRKMHRKE